MPVKTFIIDHDGQSVGLLKTLIRTYAPECNLCGTADNIALAIELIEKEHPRLLFIEVHLHGGTAFDLLDRLSFRNFELVFVTANDRYAIEAFQYDAIHYLLKPLRAADVAEALGRVRRKLRTEMPQLNVDALLGNIVQGQQDASRKISIPTLNGFDFIDLQDVLWCGSDGMYTIFHLFNGNRVISSRNIGVYEELLCANHFFRIHHSVIINMRSIKRYIKGKGGIVVLCDGTELEVSQRKKGEFLEKFVI